MQSLSVAGLKPRSAVALVPADTCISVSAKPQQNKLDKEQLWKHKSRAEASYWRSIHFLVMHLLVHFRKELNPTLTIHHVRSALFMVNMLGRLYFQVSKLEIDCWRLCWNAVLSTLCVNICNTAENLLVWLMAAARVFLNWRLRNVQYDMIWHDMMIFVYDSVQPAEHGVFILHSERGHTTYKVYVVSMATVKCTLVQWVSEQFLNGTSAQYRLYSAIQIKS